MLKAHILTQQSTRSTLRQSQPRVHLHARRQRTVASACSHCHPTSVGRKRLRGGCRAAGNADRETYILDRTNQLRLLEKERDEAISTAESCARTSVRLSEMVQLLEKRAGELVQAGSEEGAREVLKEKASVKSILEKSNERAQNNFALAAKLAEKIGHSQMELMQLLKESPQGGEQQAWQPTATAPPSAPPYTPYQAQAPPAQPYTPYQAPPPPAQPYTPYQTPQLPFQQDPFQKPFKEPWLEKLDEARERVRQAETAGTMARYTAEDSIAAARERLKQRQAETFAEARQRLAASAEESIAEAQTRLRLQEAEMLAYARRLVQRYRRGEYVSEEEMDAAFRALDSRFLR